MSNPWSFELWRAAGIGLGAIVLGSLSGRWILCGLVALALYLGSHLLQVYRLERWLREPRDLEPPEARGVWGEIYHYLHRGQRQTRAAQRRLQSLLNRFQESAAVLPDAIVVLNAEGHIEWLNQAAVRLLGLDPAQDRGHDVTNLLRQPALVSYVRGAHYDRPIEIPSPVDESRYLQALIVPYGKEERLLIVRDVTELRRLEQVRRDFVANVSHELRTPLTVVAGYLETMAEIKDLEWAGAVQAMRQQTTRMQHIVEDLLFLARLESSEVRALETQSVPVSEVIATIIEEARQLSAGQHRIEARLDERLWLLGRRNELHSAFSNIMFNAVRYTPAGGRIAVSWRADEGGAHFEVADTGPGIAEHHISRLTERFYRVDVARSRELGGTGLGLAIVKHVLNRHGAALRIESRLGQGSRFVCDFPPALIASVDKRSTGATG